MTEFRKGLWWGYGFGFNGKENLNEVTGSTGTHLDFGARVYDSRIGRFLSVDNFAGKFPFQSPFLFASNTPIMAIDNNGDSTIYYSAKGEYLGTSNDGLENGVTIIPNNKVVQFRLVSAAYEGIGSFDSDASNEQLRSMGMTYISGDLWNVFDETYNPDENGYADEYSTYLYESTEIGETGAEMRTVRPGKERFAGWHTGVIQGSNNEGGKGPINPSGKLISDAHTHPNVGLPIGDRGQVISKPFASNNVDWKKTNPRNYDQGFRIVISKGYISFYSKYNKTDYVMEGFEYKKQTSVEKVEFGIDRNKTFEK
jgi:RHS repeat-associated protein